MGIGKAEVSQISIRYPILPPMKRGSLLPRSGKYGICTDYENTYLDFPYPYLPVDVTIALVQTRYHGDW